MKGRNGLAVKVDSILRCGFEVPDEVPAHHPLGFQTAPAGWIQGLGHLQGLVEDARGLAE